MTSNNVLKNFSIVAINLLVLLVAHGLVSLILVFSYVPLDPQLGGVVSGFSGYIRRAADWWFDTSVLMIFLFFPFLFLVQFPLTSVFWIKKRYEAVTYIKCGFFTGLLHAFVFYLFTRDNLIEPLNLMIKVGYIVGGTLVGYAQYSVLNFLMKRSEKFKALNQ